MSGAPQVLLAELWERESKAGNRYFSGFLGKAQLLLFRDGERPHPTRPDETVTVWRLILQERDQAATRSSAPRGQPPPLLEARVINEQPAGGYRGDRARRAPTDQERARSAQAPLDDTELALADFDARYGPRP